MGSTKSHLPTYLPTYLPTHESHTTTPDVLLGHKTLRYVKTGIVSLLQNRMNVNHTARIQRLRHYQTDE